MIFDPCLFLVSWLVSLGLCLCCVFCFCLFLFFPLLLFVVVLGQWGVDSMAFFVRCVLKKSPGVEEHPALVDALAYH